MSRPIVLFGASGQLGRELLALASSRGVAVVGFTRAEADITDSKAVADAIERIQPRLIVNAAAYNAVDRAETDPSGAQAANVLGPLVLAEAARAVQVPIVHLSSDYVFDGTRAGAYTERDRIEPTGVYGRTKAEGEAKVRHATSQHIIVRTAWLYGRYGSNFLKTISQLARDQDVLKVVADQRGSPTSTLDLAEALIQIDRVLAHGSEPWGTYHFAGTGAASRYDFAREIVEVQAPFTGRKPVVQPIRTEDYPTPARRPANSELDSSLFAENFGYRAQAWKTRVRSTLEELLAVSKEESAP